MLHLGEWVLIFLGVGILFLIILLLILLANKKKDEKLSKGRKAAIAWLTILTSLSFIGSCLTFTNIIPLSIRVGYYEEVDDRFNHDGQDGGLKITMERKVEYSSNYNIGSEFHNDNKGKLEINGNLVTFKFSGNSQYTFEVKYFGKVLYLDGKITFRFVKDIEMRK